MFHISFTVKMLLLQGRNDKMTNLTAVCRPIRSRAWTGSASVTVGGYQYKLYVHFTSSNKSILDGSLRPGAPSTMCTRWTSGKWGNHSVWLSWSECGSGERKSPIYNCLVRFRPRYHYCSSIQWENGTVRDVYTRHLYWSGSVAAAAEDAAVNRLYRYDSEPSLHVARHSRLRSTRRQTHSGLTTELIASIVTLHRMLWRFSFGTLILFVDDVLEEHPTYEIPIKCPQMGSFSETHRADQKYA